MRPRRADWSKICRTPLTSLSQPAAASHAKGRGRRRRRRASRRECRSASVRRTHCPPPSKASAAMNRLMVKPTPHSTDAPNIATQPAPPPAAARIPAARRASTRETRRSAFRRAGPPRFRAAPAPETRQFRRFRAAAGVGECKQRQDRERNRRMQIVLQAPQRRMRCGVARAKRYEERQRDAGQRRMHAGFQHRHPQHQPDEEIGRQPRHTPAVEREQDEQRGRATPRESGARLLA